MTKGYGLTYLTELIYNLGEIELQPFEKIYIWKFDTLRHKNYTVEFFCLCVRPLRNIHMWLNKNEKRGKARYAFATFCILIA